MAVDEQLLLVVGSDSMGDGEVDLGYKLMGAFLTQLVESGAVPAKAIFLNSGIYLTTEGSPVADQVQALERKGCAVFSCGTCLDYYGRTDKLLCGQVGNMRDTVRAMLDYEKLIRP